MQFRESNFYYLTFLNVVLQLEVRRESERGRDHKFSPLALKVFPLTVTSEVQPEKFHTDDVKLQRSVDYFELVAFWF